MQRGFRLHRSYRIFGEVLPTPKRVENRCGCDRERGGRKASRRVVESSSISPLFAVLVLDPLATVVAADDDEVDTRRRGNRWGTSASEREETR